MMMGFAERITARRKDLRLTQQALADRAGIHMMQVHRYESGASMPSLDALKKLTLALRVSADHLLFEEDERGPSDDLRLQFEALAQFDDEARKVAKTLLDGLILQNQAKRLAAAE